MWIAPEWERVQRWIVPASAVGLGLIVGVTLVVRDRAVAGLAATALLAGYGVLLGYRRREAVLPIHAGHDSGQRMYNHVRAAAMTGDVLVVVILAAFVVQALRDGGVANLAWLALLAAATYTASFLALERGGR